MVTPVTGILENTENPRVLVMDTRVKDLVTVTGKLTKNWYMAIDASTATLRPVKESSPTSFMHPGTSSDSSFDNP